MLFLTLLATSQTFIFLEGYNYYLQSTATYDYSYTWHHTAVSDGRETGKCKYNVYTRASLTERCLTILQYWWPIRNKERGQVTIATRSPATLLYTVTNIVDIGADRRKTIACCSQYFSCKFPVYFSFCIPVTILFLDCVIYSGTGVLALYFIG